MELIHVLVIVFSTSFVLSYPFSEGDIRLVGGSEHYEGTVLIFHDNKWGSVCDYNWDLRDAHVVCRQLGYPRALQYVHSSRFGRGRRRIWLADVYCRGYESNLSECYNPGWGRLYRRHETRCRGHRHSAGVVCLDTPSTHAPSTLPPSAFESAVVQNNDIVEIVNSQIDEDVLLADDADNVPLPPKQKESYDDEISEKDLAKDATTAKPTTTPKPTTTTRPTTTTTLTTTTTPTTTTTTPTTTTTTPTTTTTTQTTTTTPTTTTKTTTSTKATTTKLDEAAKIPNMRKGVWKMDKDIERWVMPLRTGKYLIAIPGARPQKMTKDEYIGLRRRLIAPPVTTAQSYVIISNEVVDEIDEVDNIAEQMKSDDPNVVAEEIDERGLETSQNLVMADETAKETNQDIDTDVKEMIDETTKEKVDDDENKAEEDKNKVNENILPIKSTEKPITTTTTTSTTPKPTTTRATTPKPTTTKAMTLKPTTTRATTPKPTTTTRATTPVPRTTVPRSVINDRASNLPNLRLNSWTMDNEAILWVLKLRDGNFMVSKPGQSPTKMTRGEYIAKRREIFRSTATTTTAAPRNRYSAANRQSRNNITMSDSASIMNIYDRGSSSRIIGTRERIDGRSSVDNTIGGLTSQSGHRHRHGNSAGHRRHERVKIQLSGGRSGLDGRIEVLPPEQQDWGVICGDTWSLKEAIVACKHFGLGYGQQGTKSAYYGGKNQKKYFSSVRCKGTEKSLDQCEWEDHNGLIQCSRADSVATIVCAKSLPDLEPSTYMVESTAFLQDRHMYYLTCAMEENCLAQSAYELKRTSSRWRQSTRRLLRFSSVVKNKGTADFKPKSQRSDWEWHACHMHYHSMEVFAHYDITDLNGNRVAEGLKASFCLEDSQCDSGVYPKYDCQHYGQQGISVGCSDNYMADIDCQWIDISDLKPGNYNFKLEVNPSLMVPEISFDNNGMDCNLHYSGYYARISNCKLRSLL